MTRVLVVDDSKFMRTVIGNALDEAGYEVETAANGADGVELASTFDPDVVTMDVEMPEMGGIDAVERIMATNPTMILMLSVHTERGTEATLDALERGAVDFLHKPDGSDSRNIAHLTDEVVAKVDDFAEANVSSVALARATAAAHSTRSGRAGGPGHNTVTGNAVAGGGSDAQLRHDSGTTGPDATPDIGTTSATDEAAEPIAVDGDWADAPTIVLGASTGGPKIVERLFERLPADLEAKVLVVQHMPPTLRPASPSDSTLGARTTSPKPRIAIGSRPARPRSHRETPTSRLRATSAAASVCDSTTASGSTACGRRST